jgi:hypothetical protein
MITNVGIAIMEGVTEVLYQLLRSLFQQNTDVTRNATRFDISVLEDLTACKILSLYKEPYKTNFSKWGHIALVYLCTEGQVCCYSNSAIAQDKNTQQCWQFQQS